MCTFCWEAPQGHPRCGEGPGPASREGLTLGQDGLTGVGSAALDRVLDLHRSHLGTWGTFLAVSVQGELRAGGPGVAPGAQGGSCTVRQGPGCASWDLRGSREGRAPGLQWAWVLVWTPAPAPADWGLSVMCSVKMCS